MKSFLEEYGFAILAAIVIILLIAMASPLGDIIRTQLSNIVNKFANSANKKLDAADAGDATAILAGQDLTIFANSTTDEFKGYLHGVHGGTNVIYKINATKVAETGVVPTVTEGESNMVDFGTERGQEISDDVYGALDSGSEYYIELVNTGTSEHFYTNRVKKA